MRSVHALVAACAVAVSAPVAGCTFDTTAGADSPPGDPSDPDPPPGGDVHLDAGAPDPEPVAATAFRITEISLRDPHMYALSGFGGGCNDITDGGGSVNGRIAELLSGDGDQDGYLDRGLVLAFRPFSPEIGAHTMEIATADCTAPADATTCAVTGESIATVARNVGADACDVPPAQTVTGYDPPIEIAGAPCFAADAIEYELMLEVAVPHTDFVVAATFSPDGDELTGVLRGFVSEQDADGLELGGGGAVMSAFLPGGDGSCTVHDARDTGPEGESGWYVYYNFAAEVVPLAP